MEEYDRMNQLCKQVIGAAIEVHKELGPGLLESVYEDCLKTELLMQGIYHQSQTGTFDCSVVTFNVYYIAIEAYRCIGVIDVTIEAGGISCP